MKQILFVPCILLMLMLSGCTVAPSMLGNNIAGIGNGGVQESQMPMTINAPKGETSLVAGPPQSAGSPGSTGSIVPLREEGAVVDLPDSSVSSTRASATFQQGQTSSGEESLSTPEGEQASSADERHRRELINRGDLTEGQSLPVE